MPVQFATDTMEQPSGAGSLTENASSVHDLAFGLARRRVTVSTSGIIPEIDRLKDDTNVSLAISLHASNNELRNSIVPINRSFPLADLLAACKRFSEGRDDDAVTIEYVMLNGINDSIQDARDLVK